MAQPDSHLCFSSKRAVLFFPLKFGFTDGLSSPIPAVDRPRTSLHPARDSRSPLEVEQKMLAGLVGIKNNPFLHYRFMVVDIGADDFLI